MKYILASTMDFLCFQTIQFYRSNGRVAGYWNVTFET